MDARRWMAAVGCLYVVVGIALAVVSFFPAGLQRVNQLVVPGAGPPDAALRLYAGVVGGLIAGLGAVVAAVARALDGGRVAIARAVTLGVLVWYLVDTASSLAHGSWQNALGNTIFLVATLPPLLAIRPVEAAR